MPSVRKCIHCDQPVKEIPAGIRQFGIAAPEEGYIHISPNQDGVPNCGRRTLAEHQTYTEGSSDGSNREDEF